MKTITIAQLERAKACADQVQIFRDIFGTSAALTPENWQRAGDAGLNRICLVQIFPSLLSTSLSTALWEEYEAARLTLWAKLLAAYETARAPLLTRYEAASLALLYTALRADYDAACLALLYTLLTELPSYET